MSTKFEQLLDLIVNEEMDKANELFHEIVVEKSRDIYENLIAEEGEDADVEESMDDDVEESMDDDVEESMDDTDDVEEGVEEDTDESVDLEDSYSMEADDEEGLPGEEKTGDFGADIGATDDEMDGAEGGEDSAIFDIKNAIAELEAAFAELEQAKGMGGDEFDDKGEMDGEEEPMKMGFQEGRRMTREYTENVGTNWEKGATQKAQGQYAGAGTGDKEGAPVEGKSPISSGSGKPNSGANAKNLAQGQYLGAGTGEKDGAPVEGRSPISSGAGKPVGGKNVGAGNIVRADTEGQSNTGTSPAKVNKGINPESSEKFAKGMHNVDGAKSGVKTLSNVKGGHGAEKKGAGPGPVGSGTGDKAGQTSVGKIPQFLKPAN